MKLLHFGLYDLKEPQHALRNALKGICKEYYEFSFVAKLKTAQRDFHQLMLRRKPDVVFMQVQTPGVITADMLKRYPSVKFFNFSGDVREEIPKWFFEVAPYCTTLFTNTDWVEAIRAMGNKAEYFQVGFDHNIYRPTGPQAKTKPVVFLGNNHGNGFQLSKLRGDMVERFKHKPWFQVYGRGWGKDVVDLNYKQTYEAAVYRGAKIGINLSHMDLGSYTSDRMFRLMGSGCMCLAYRHKDISNEFYNGAHLVTWGDLDELETLIESYLIDPSREDVAKLGCNRVHRYYTWPVRMQQLKEMI